MNNHLFLKLSSNEHKRTANLLLVGSLLLAVVFGCSPFKPHVRHSGWNLQDACGYLDDVGMNVGRIYDGKSCLGGGFVRSEESVLHQEKRPGNLGSASYRVRGEATKAEGIEFSIASFPDTNNSNHRAFLDYSQKLFKKVFNRDMPEQMRNDITNLGKSENDITGKGSVNKPFKYSVDNTEVKISSGYTYKIAIKR